MNGKNVGLIGRRRLITKEGVAKMNDELTNDTIRLQADLTVDFKRRCQEKIGQERGWNSLVPTDSIPISAKTISNYIQEGDFATRKARTSKNLRQIRSIFKYKKSYRVCRVVYILRKRSRL
jgi:hypothetical protein